MITYGNNLLTRKRSLLSKRQVKYVEYIIVTIDMANLRMSRREVIQTISDIGQASSYIQEENYFDYLIR